MYSLQWLYNKMCALPLPEVLCDFEDAIKVNFCFAACILVISITILVNPCYIIYFCLQLIIKKMNKKNECS